jgi:hypothetical protein
MRLIAASLMLVLSLPVIAASPSPRRQCQSRCSVDYDLCMRRGRDKKARKTCAVLRKTCKYGCPTR